MPELSRKLRCAIYTRKSTEDGLQQEFNSLDAQYEACRAYILSQRHEGWSLLSERYDDGGFSGGNLERPGLKNLLEQVASGKVDIIVIYKVDRLTRSLADFAKIVDVLDAASASFVSITQSFNTTTSMGRLTLNMLLSFAQFEREVTSERIRDKIAASKRKGIWMGGPVPLGYEVQERKLVVNPAEAETVRHIMRRYCELSSVSELVAELRRDGVVTKVQKRVSGPHKGGIPFARGALYHLLKNRIYLGEIVHKGAAYPGEHHPIVAIELWDRVQVILGERATSAATRNRAKRPSLLAGLLFDGLGRRMVPSHTTKGTRSYRYYVTRPDLLADGLSWRINAHDVENIVRSQVAEVLRDRFELARLMQGEADVQQLPEAYERAASISEAVHAGPPSTCLTFLQQLIHSVKLHEDRILTQLDKMKLVSVLRWPTHGSPDDEIVTLTCAVSRVRRGHSLRLLTPTEAIAVERTPKRNEKLIRLIAEAHAARQLVEAAPDKPLSKIALEQKRCRTRLAGLIAISCLAPDIALALVKGKQPKRFDRRTLLSGSLPLEWLAQRDFLGFADDANAAPGGSLDD